MHKNFNTSYYFNVTISLHTLFIKLMQPRGSTLHSVFLQRMERKGYKMVYGDHRPE